MELAKNFFGKIYSYGPYRGRAALNSGVVWPRNSWLKYPGTVDIHFLEPVQPGLTRKQFMAKLEQRIENKMAVLDSTTPESKLR